MSAPRESRGLALGLLGVTIFAMTLPMTRLAVGSVESPQLSPLFVATGRAAFAGLLSLIYLRLTRAALPPRQAWVALVVCALGTVFAWPLFLGLALREVDAMHAAVITGVLPLVTAIAAAVATRQRPSLGFWVCAVLGCAVVLGFAAWQGSGHLQLADGWLLLAAVCTSIGYVAGERMTHAGMSAEHVICWVLVCSLPINAPLAAWAWPGTPVSWAAWGGFAYVTVFSMWLGFFAWYRGLAMGGAVRVSQVQLVQPFLSLLFAVPVLGEQLELATVAVSIAVIAIVFVGKRMSVGAQPAPVVLTTPHRKSVP